MNTKDNTINDTYFKKFLKNDAYYKNIFKKTEKIVSVVFYILNNVDSDKKSETQIGNLASKAHFVHENALRTLEVKPVSAKEVLEQFAQALVGLDSTLRIAAVSNVITADAMHVVTGEIDVVLRGLGSYILENNGTDELIASSVFGQQSTPQKTISRSTGTSDTQKNTAQQATSAQAQVSDRRERIKTILEAKGEATIKDISEIVTDCSEKTIQRELNAMIEENLVKRQGERRWSKYSIF